MSDLPAIRRPIVLACGIARFDAMRESIAKVLKPTGISFADSRHYFKGIKSHLEADGHQVFHTKVSFAAGVETRAQQLADQINAILAESGAAQVDLIAHSMGGLDARHMIVGVDGMSNKIHSLTTIGTPHKGSTMADYMLENGLADWVVAFRKIIDLDGVHDLTTAACQAFNEKAEASEAVNDIIYSTWSSASHEVFRPLKSASEVITEAEGPNDGLVSVASQQWKPVLIGPTDKIVRQRQFPFPADHLNQLGWWGPPSWDAPFHSLSVISEWKKKFRETEQQVKDLYLRIADELSGL